MTTLEAAKDLSRPEDRSDASPLRSITAYLYAHRLSIVTVGALMVICCIATSYNLMGYPVRFKDEGVYIAQAWAIPNMHALANYTYWYDHPPVGWIQMSIWFELTRGLERWSTDTTIAGREFAVFMRIVACALMFVLARRLGMRRTWASFAVLIFIFSPLAMYYGRLALLDNIAVPWLLASIVFALTPRHRLWAVAGSAACLSVAILTKETTALLAPAVFLALWQNFRTASNRRHAHLFFIGLTVMLPCLYLVYAVVKSEFIPGTGHVSLIEALQWQLSSRMGSGSVFDANSDARHLANGWLALDKWLPLCGILSLVLLLPVKRYWPISLALGIQLLMMLRTGYLPSMYIIALLPFMALLIAAVGNHAWPQFRLAITAIRESGLLTRKSLQLSLRCALVVVLGCGVYSYAHMDWHYTLQNQFTADADVSQRETVDWIGANIPHDATIVSEGEFWLDLRNEGFDGDGNIWVYKVDTDPEATENIRSRGGIDYLALSETTLVSESKETLPMVFDAIERSERIATFGEGGDQMVVMKVHK